MKCDRRPQTAAAKDLFLHLADESNLIMRPSLSHVKCNQMKLTVTDSLRAGSMLQASHLV